MSEGSEGSEWDSERVKERKGGDDGDLKEWKTS